VSGNCSAEEAERCARVLLEAADAPAVPLLRGGSSFREAGAAGEALAALPAETRLVAIGPLSNLADAIARDADLPRRARLSVVGGNLSSRGFLPPLWPHEFNLAKDRTSARRALGAPWLELVFYPLDVLRRFRADAARLDAVGAFGEPGRLLARESARWLESTRWRFGYGGFPVWDLVPALVAADALDVVVRSRAFRRERAPPSTSTPGERGRRSRG
jgi:inosine-uridine nucleoside N-ribohydrolase